MCEAARILSSDGKQTSSTGQEKQKASQSLLCWTIQCLLYLLWDSQTTTLLWDCHHLLWASQTFFLFSASHYLLWATNFHLWTNHLLRTSQGLSSLLWPSQHLHFTLYQPHQLSLQIF
ncbi:hypothetical protein QQF64_023884 [Cirrhinus molitorella]|uniref:Uncharacterized protein n=1 Tax=Cirrhinus molitorella TaxID=172907 RepID=A0ABR3NJP0_9TELE